MKRNVLFPQFFIIAFLAMGLASCAQQRVQPAESSQVQQAYAVRDELIIAKTALNDLYAQEKLRRVSHPESKPLISDTTYKAAYNASKEADTIVIQLISIARGTNGSNGTLAMNLKIDAERKIAEINAVNGSTK